jgi:hypothetical protein
MNNNLNNLDKKSLDFYLNQPDINNYINKFNLKNLLKLSTETDLYLFKKKKNTWILKDKRVILKECEYKKKQTVKEATCSINNLTKNKELKYEYIKEQTNNLLNKVGNIDSIIESIQQIYPLLNEEYNEIYSNN